MRAARLLTVLAMLQERGRLTAEVLAAQLDVSTRTVLRDVQALSEAGVPVYTVQGAGGGIELLPAYRFALHPLTDETAAALLLAGHPLLARALGLASSAAAARQVVLAAVPASQREAASVDRWLLIDPIGGLEPSRAAVVERAARACRERLEVALTGASVPARVVWPLGLVLDAGRWLLVHRSAEDAGPQLTPLDGTTDVRLRPARCPAPEGFDLTEFWRHRRA